MTDLSIIRDACAVAASGRTASVTTDDPELADVIAVYMLDRDGADFSKSGEHEYRFPNGGRLKIVRDALVATSTVTIE